jgi:hypothetical protein
LCSFVRCFGKVLREPKNDEVVNSMILTLGQAAKAANVSKSTISRAIKEGRLSSNRNDSGEYEIDPAELFRVYPVKNQNREQPILETVGNGVALGELEQLRERLRDKDSYLDSLQNQIEDLKKDRDHWRQQVTHLIEDRTKKEQVIEKKLAYEQELIEKLVHEKNLKEWTEKKLQEERSRLDKVRHSWIGRVLFSV